MSTKVIVRMLVAIGAVLLIASAPASAQILDQVSPVIQNGSSNLDVQWVTQQEVIVGLAGPLVQIDLFTQAPGSCTFEIIEASPWTSMPPSFSATFTGTTAGTWESIDVSSAGLSFLPGDTFTIQFIGTGGGLWVGSAWDFFASDPHAGYYPGRYFQNGMPMFFGAMDIAFRSYVSEPAGPTLDIKPGSCPNPLNRSSHGVLPVAVVGSEAFDVMEIDVWSVVLERADGVGGVVAPNEGPPGPHSEYEDVATQFEGESCDCHGEAGDGITDLSMKFRTDEVVEVLELGDLDAGALVELVVSGNLLDGTPFAVSDCVRLVPTGSGAVPVLVDGGAAGSWVDVSPLDSTLDGGGFGSFVRSFPGSTVVTLGAAEAFNGQAFIVWEINGVPQNPGQTMLQLTLPEPRTMATKVNVSAIAIYETDQGKVDVRPMPGFSPDKSQTTSSR